jgi:hypothetical protein
MLEAEQPDGYGRPDCGTGIRLRLAPGPPCGKTADAEVCMRGTDLMRRGRASACLLHWRLADQAMP